MIGRQQVKLSAGTIRYREAGEGPPLVFVHGLLNDGGLWDPVVERLKGSYRCIAPDWPLGSHAVPLNTEADLSPRGVARLIGELLEELDLRDVTLVANDTGGALTQLFLADGDHDRVARVMFTPCDAFDNFPPAMFRPLLRLARVPGALRAYALPLKLRRLRGLPIAFGRLAKHGVPDELSDRWLAPFFTEAGVRRDASRFLTGIESSELEVATDKLRSFDKPVLLAWATEDRFFPIEHGRRLEKLLPDARLVEIPDSYTYVSLDQPERLAGLIKEFVPAPAVAA